MLSLGSDQRLRRWSLAEAWRPLQEVLLGTADPHHMVLVPEGSRRLVLVVGNGVEIVGLREEEVKKEK